MEFSVEDRICVNMGGVIKTADSAELKMTEDGHHSLRALLPKQALVDVLAQEPVSIAIEADNFSFQLDCHKSGPEEFYGPRSRRSQGVERFSHSHSWRATVRPPHTLK